MATTNLIFAGVGGQGVLLIAELAALSAVNAGFDVKQTEVHGVSQRGGNVESHVRFGPEVHSPLVMAGTADVVLGLEKLEALRYAGYLKLARPLNGNPQPAEAGDTGILLVNDHEIVPGSVAGAADKYPYHALDYLRQHSIRVLALPGAQAAKDLGDGRAANVVMLGALSYLLSQVSQEIWEATLAERIPPKIRALNLRAFAVGRDLAQRQIRA
jgi:indolepyruvate ferredoxin oxidoreductase beta subunit